MGRPPNPENAHRKRVPLSLRVTQEIKCKLDAAAQASGRSQSQQAEFWMERGCDLGWIASEMAQILAAGSAPARAAHRLEADAALLDVLYGEKAS
jgi:hypothetical protein